MAKIKLSTYLSEKRTQAGMTQSEVSNALGYSTPQFISNWERGISAPPLETIKKLAKLYDISSDELFEVLLNDSIEQVQKSLTLQFYGSSKRKKA